MRYKPELGRDGAELRSQGGCLLEWLGIRDKEQRL